MFKKSIFLAVFLGFLAFPTVSKAQVADYATSAQVADLQAQINQLMEVLKLLQMIETLTAQINALSTQQTNTQVQLGAVQSQVENVATQTAPKVEMRPPTTPVSVSVGRAYCHKNTGDFRSDLDGKIYSVSRVDVGVTGTWDTVEIVTEGYRNGYLQNNIAPLEVSYGRVAKNRVLRNIPEHKDFMYHPFVGVSGLYPFKVVVDGETKYEGTVSVPECLAEKN